MCGKMQFCRVKHMNLLFLGTEASILLGSMMSLFIFESVLGFDILKASQFWPLFVGRTLVRGPDCVP